MPISQDGTVVPIMPHQINVPVPDGSGYSVTVMIQSDGTPGADAAMDTALMSLTDHLQEWPGRRPDADVTAQKGVYTVYPVTPTNPVPPPPPPVEEPLSQLAPTDI